MAIVILPFRMAFSMPIDNSVDGSGQHCKAMVMVSMTQNVLTQSFDMQSPDVDDKAVVKGDCCNTSDNDCAGCAHITAVYYFGFLQFSEPSENDIFSETPLSFITRIIPPPSRPPLVPHV